jgi:hypothetical protein
MARPTKLNADVQEKITQALMSGATVEKVCAFASISEWTYYNWVAIGNAYNDGIDHERMPRLIKDRKALSQFSQNVTYARASAHIKASSTLRGAMSETQSKTNTTETTIETRLRKIKKQDGSVEEVPYDYQKTITRQGVTTHPPDWRAAVEFLKRRDSDKWSDKHTLVLDDWRTRLLEDIQKGTVVLPDVIQAFGGQEDFVNAINEPSLATQLFAAAGLQLQDRQS